MLTRVQRQNSRSPTLIVFTQGAKISVLMVDLTGDLLIRQHNGAFEEVNQPRISYHVLGRTGDGTSRAVDQEQGRFREPEEAPYLSGVS